MKNRSTISLKTSVNRLGLVGLITLVLALSGLAQESLKPVGKSAGRAMGEIVSARQATINGASVITGMTVFSNNRIRTAPGGAAIVNLGKIGRVELGPDADLTLTFSPGAIGGELRSSNIIVSAPAGVAISIKTEKGMVTTDGQKPAVLTIYADQKNSRVMTHLGEALVTSSSQDGRVKTNRVVEGEELSQAAAANAVPIPARISGKISGPNVPATLPFALGFAGLIGAGIGYSLPPDEGHSIPVLDTSITCANSETKPCHRKSEYKP